MNREYIMIKEEVKRSIEKVEACRVKVNKAEQRYDKATYTNIFQIKTEAAQEAQKARDHISLFVELYKEDLTEIDIDTNITSARHKACF